MDYITYKQSGDCNQTLQGRRINSFPVSCANRTVGFGTYNTTPAIFGTFRSVYSNRTPGFFKIKAKKGWLPDNAFSSSKREVTSHGSSNLRWTYVTPSCTPPLNPWDEAEGRLLPAYLGSNLGTSRAIADGRDGDLQTQIITECLANRQKGAANYVESLAELDQLFATVRDPFINLRNALDQFDRSAGYRKLERLRKEYRGSVRPFSRKYWEDALKRKVKNSLLLNLIKLTTSEYLRYRYAINPAINDCREALRTLRRNYKQTAHTDLHTARAAGTIFGQATSSYTNSDAYVSIKRRLVATQSFSVHAKWTDAYAGTPWSDLGLNFQNLVGLPWELTHYSFVLDWMFNVGDFIYANTPRVNVNAKGGSYFTKDQIYNVWSFDGYTSLQPLVLVYSGSLGDIVKIDALDKNRRIIVPSSSQVGLVIKSDFRLDSWTRACDAFSLAFQAAGKVSF